MSALSCSTADFKVGLSLEIDSAPWRITGACEATSARERDASGTRDARARGGEEDD